MAALTLVAVLLAAPAAAAAAETAPLVPKAQAEQLGCALAAQLQKGE